MQNEIKRAIVIVSLVFLSIIFVTSSLGCVFTVMTYLKPSVVHHQDTVIRDFIGNNPQLAASFLAWEKTANIQHLAILGKQSIDLMEKRIVHLSDSVRDVESKLPVVVVDNLELWMTITIAFLIFVLVSIVIVSTDFEKLKRTCKEKLS